MAKQQVSFVRAQDALRRLIVEMDGTDMERAIEEAFFVKNVEYDPETDKIEFEPLDDRYGGELDE